MLILFCRYKLLLSDLLKNTLPEDDDYAALTGLIFFVAFASYFFYFVMQLYSLQIPVLINVSTRYKRHVDIVVMSVAECEWV